MTEVNGKEYAEVENIITFEQLVQAQNKTEQNAESGEEEVVEKKPKKSFKERLKDFWGHVKFNGKKILKLAIGVGVVAGAAMIAISSPFLTPVLAKIGITMTADLAASLTSIGAGLTTPKVIGSAVDGGKKVWDGIVGLFEKYPGVEAIA